MTPTRCFRCENVIQVAEDFLIEDQAAAHIICPPNFLSGPVFVQETVSELIARLPMRGRPKSLKQLGLKMKETV
jgi:hypothetical protein